MVNAIVEAMRDAARHIPFPAACAPLQECQQCIAFATTF
jgi:hypothetical protein